MPLALPLALAAPLAAAQSAAPNLPAAEACSRIEIDAERLACYDAVHRHTAIDPATADAQASRAKEAKSDIVQLERHVDRLERAALPPEQRTRPGANDLYSSEPALASLEARIANAGKGSLLDSRWELARDSKLGVFNLRAYKPVYLLPAVWNSNPNELPTSSNPDVPAVHQSLKDTEAKFQLSFKTKAVENLFGDNGDIWMGYTQSSRWQVYNGGDASRPFRESNYEPEVLAVFRTGYSLGGWHGRMAAIGINHQSNGRADPLSRSWNRVMVNIGLDRENWALMLRPWWRISDGDDDENPNIEDYIGRGDATLTYVRNGHEFSLAARHSLRGGDDSRGAVQFDWGFPLTRNMRGHVQIFDGYGESLIDYDHRATHIGLGVSLLEWF
ncbi:phospholipase [Lysobacter arseniciresistens ZS79]|uniref:Phospholipase A1 n=1 Tax=Lysobacter arseniciresistens ZS79 TaxID=913325 RepID=A0A0A0F4E2_9GAMM|nr:phospholipase [Lysobacter arseniciresistens ZS79]